MSLIKAIVLGIVQGVTEFLPISSSGHLVVIGNILAVDTGGSVLFDILLHGGTLVVIIIYFREEIKSILFGCHWCSGSSSQGNSRGEFLLSGEGGDFPPHHRGHPPCHQIYQREGWGWYPPPSRYPRRDRPGDRHFSRDIPLRYHHKPRALPRTSKRTRCPVLLPHLHPCYPRRHHTGTAKAKPRRRELLALPLPIWYNSGSGKRLFFLGFIDKYLGR